ncbi:MAG: response regulator [Thermoanaerobaculia bacterium]|nr:response regulator [Thermoanaerobaculia bacterium]
MRVPAVNGVKKILVVDDDMHVREMLVQRLRSRGFEVEGSDSATSAMQKLDAVRYDLVVLDLILPREGGKVVVEQVLAAHNGTQLIIMSGVARLWRKANPSVRVAGVLEKPFAFDELLHFVNNS